MGGGQGQNQPLKHRSDQDDLTDRTLGDTEKFCTLDSNFDCLVRDVLNYQLIPERFEWRTVHLCH